MHEHKLITYRLWFGVLLVTARFTSIPTHAAIDVATICYAEKWILYIKNVGYGPFFCSDSRFLRRPWDGSSGSNYVFIKISFREVHVSSLQIEQPLHLYGTTRLLYDALKPVLRSNRCDAGTSANVRLVSCICHYIPGFDVYLSPLLNYIIDVYLNTSWVTRVQT